MHHNGWGSIINLFCIVSQIYLEILVVRRKSGGSFHFRHRKSWKAAVITPKDQNNSLKLCQRAEHPPPATPTPHSPQRIKTPHYSWAKAPTPPPPPHTHSHIPKRNNLQEARGPLCKQETHHCPNLWRHCRKGRKEKKNQISKNL